MTTSTSTETQTVEEAIVFPGEQYVETGGYGPDVTDVAAWADEFKALGGISCGIRPGWAWDFAGHQTPDSVVVAIVTGTPEAVAFAIDGIVASAGSPMSTKYRVETILTEGFMSRGENVAFIATGYTHGGKVAFCSEFSGRFDHIAEDEGDLYVFMTGGEINGIPQTQHAFPLSQLVDWKERAEAGEIHGFRNAADDKPEICTCGAAFVEGFNLGSMKTAHVYHFATS